MKKSLALLGVLALLCGCLAACGTPKTEALLAGKWNASAASFEFQAFEFTPDENNPGKGTVGSLLDGSYEIIPAENKDTRDMLKITFSFGMLSASRSYYFTVDETTLSLQEENSSVTTTYTREAAAGEATTA